MEILKKEESIDGSHVGLRLCEGWGGEASQRGALAAKPESYCIWNSPRMAGNYIHVSFVCPGHRGLRLSPGVWVGPVPVPWR